MLHFEKRALVTPGDLLAEGDYVAGENTYKEDDKIYATRIGLFNYDNRKVHVVALKAFYIPSPGDLVIGKVVDIGLKGWTVDINSPYMALLRASDGLGKIREGRIIKVTPTKIPRVIGKKGSMINLIKRQTGCQIVIGQNGVILVRGRDLEKVNLAVEAIMKIEDEAHTTGLTDRINEMLKM